jgi:hypothetical protein
LDGGYRRRPVGERCPHVAPEHRRAAANGPKLLMILGISVEQVIDHAAASRVGREISFAFSSAGRRPEHPRPVRHAVGQLDPLATLIMLAGLYGCDSYGARHVAYGVIDIGSASEI